MKLAILGGTGRTGAPLVREALAAGHDVRALVRSPERAAARLASHDHLEPVIGDLLEPSTVHEVVAGAEVVIDVTGPAPSSPPDLRRRSSTVLLEAMGSAGVDRLVALTGAGVRADGDRPTVPDRLIRGVMGVVARDVLADAEGYVAAVRGSDLRWTVVRAPRLVDAPARGRVRVATNLGGDVGSKLGRDDLATFLLAAATDGSYVRELPVVSW